MSAVRNLTRNVLKAPARIVEKGITDPNGLVEGILNAPREVYRGTKDAARDGVNRWNKGGKKKAKKKA